MSDKDNPYRRRRQASMPPMSSYGGTNATPHARLATAVAAAVVKDTTTASFRRRCHPGIAQAAGAGRFLGAVVRAVQAAAAGAGKGRSLPPAARSSWSR